MQLLRPGDTFMFAGRLLRFVGTAREFTLEVAWTAATGEPKVPTWEGAAGCR